MTEKKRPWPQDEDIKLMALVGDGHHYRPIKEAFDRDGHKRTIASIRQRIRWLRMTPEERRKCSRGKNRRQGKSRNEISYHLASEKVIVPQAVIDDRERRYAAPRTLTGAMFGDPPHGFSCLERRA